jgi:5'-deoxynucleotidase YfbR-like HD superfamily hydrolase
MNYQHVIEMVRTGGVQRYHTNAGIMLKTQDLGQHCYGVFWLCYYLSRCRPSANLMLAAMSHDAGEMKTGDMPSPTKRALGVTDEMDMMESEFLRTKCSYTGAPLEPDEIDVLGLADSLDGVLFCAKEAQMGNRAHKLTFRNFIIYTEAKIDGIQPIPQHIDYELAKEIINYARNTYESFIG